MQEACRISIIVTSAWMCTLVQAAPEALYFSLVLSTYAGAITMALPLHGKFAGFYQQHHPNT